MIYGKITRTFLIVISLLVFMQGCASSTRFGKIEETRIIGRPVESTDGKYLTKIPPDWVSVEDNDSGVLFTFADKDIQAIMVLSKIAAGKEVSTAEQIIPLVKAQIKVSKKDLKELSETGTYHGSAGFYYVEQDNGFCNIFIENVSGTFWESRLYLKPGVVNKKEQLISLQHKILLNITSN